MTWTPPREWLNGLSYERAECYGKPHLGKAYYQPYRMGGNRLDVGATCAVCGKPACNSHHQPPRSSGSSLFGWWRGEPIELLPALVSVCGMGNAAGCHAHLHSGRYRLEWRWDCIEHAQDWWTGELFRQGYKPHDKRLYRLGAWHLVNAKQGWERVLYER